MGELKEENDIHWEQLKAEKNYFQWERSKEGLIFVWKESNFPPFSTGPHLFWTGGLWEEGRMALPLTRWTKAALSAHN